MIGMAADREFIGNGEAAFLSGCSLERSKSTAGLGRSEWNGVSRDLCRYAAKKKNEAIFSLFALLRHCLVKRGVRVSLSLPSTSSIMFVSLNRFSARHVAEWVAAEARADCIFREIDINSQGMLVKSSVLSRQQFIAGSDLLCIFALETDEDIVQSDWTTLICFSCESINVLR